MSDSNEFAVLTRRMRRMERGLIVCLVALLALAGLVVHDRSTSIGELRLRDANLDTRLVLKPDSIRLSRGGAAGHVTETVISAGSVHFEEAILERTQRFVEVSLTEVDVIDYRNQRRAVLSPMTIGLQSGLPGDPNEQPAWTMLRPDGFLMNGSGGRKRILLGRVDHRAAVDALVIYGDHGERIGQFPESIRD